MRRATTAAIAATLGAVFALAPATSGSAATAVGSATFRDPVCDVSYFDWFSGAGGDCSAADIKSVLVRYGAKTTVALVTFAGMRGGGLVAPKDLSIEVDFDSADDNAGTNFRFDYHGPVGTAVFRGSGGVTPLCKLSQTVSIADHSIRLAAPTSCVRRTMPTGSRRIRIKASADATYNECPPGDCTDEWLDFLNYPNDNLNHTWWTSYVRRS